MYIIDNKINQIKSSLLNLTNKLLGAKASSTDTKISGLDDLKNLTNLQHTKNDSFISKNVASSSVIASVSIEQEENNFPLKLKSLKDIPIEKLKNIFTQEDLDELMRLPPEIREIVLTKNINYKTMSKEQIHKQVKDNFKILISNMIPNNNIDIIEKDKGKWSISNLVSLYNVIEKVPSVHRNNLTGVKFVRDDMPDAPDGKSNAAAKASFFEKIALSLEAGAYKLHGQNKQIIIYDRGANPKLNLITQDINKSIDNIKLGNKTEVKSLQTILRLIEESKKGSSNLKIDGIYGPQTKRAVRELQIDCAKKIISKQIDLSKNETLDKNITKLLQDIAAGKYNEILSNNKADELFKPYGIKVDSSLKNLIINLANQTLDKETLRIFLGELMEGIAYRKGTLTENILAHEIGHAVQLSGSEYDTKIISEFAKISGWVNTEDGTIATGTKMGIATLEDRVDAFANVISKGKIDRGIYTSNRKDNFVTEYAKTDPTDDFAESYKMFIFDPVYLMQKSPEKFLFINALSRVQVGNHKYIKGDPTKDAYYKSNEVLSIASQAGISNVQLKEAFYNISGYNNSKFNMSPDISNAILDTHRDLLPKIDFNFNVYLDLSSPENKVMSKINGYASMLAENNYKIKEKSMKFYKLLLSNPQEAIGKNDWNKLSPDMQQKLQDKSYIAMLYAIGKINGYIWQLHQAKLEEAADKKDYDNAREHISKTFLTRGMLSRETVKSSVTLVREQASKVYNPEKIKMEEVNKFLELLKYNPQKALGNEIWDNLSPSFREQFRDSNFVDTITGYQGEYLINYRSLQENFSLEWEQQKILDYLKAKLLDK